MKNSMEFCRSRRVLSPNSAVNEKWLTARFVFTIKQRDISQLTKMVICDVCVFYSKQIEISQLTKNGLLQYLSFLL